MLILRLKRGSEKPLLKGFPWAFEGDIQPSSDQLLMPPGALAELRTYKDKFAAIGTFNAEANLRFRVLTNKREAIDEAFFERRLHEALKRRRRYDAPYYRLVHAESDGLPGLVIDRFGDSFVLQISTAGMERLTPMLLAALEKAFSPAAIVLRNDVRARESEGLNREVRVAKGAVTPTTEVHENGCIFAADLLYGQKTGWFYDQRDNRALVAEHAKDKRVLDLFCHSGGFGVLAAQAGARSVLMVDSSERALELAKIAAEKNNVTDQCSFREDDVWDALESLSVEGRRYDIVIADPPAFAKSRSDAPVALRAYGRMAGEAAGRVEAGGLLFIASCSHHAPMNRFRLAVLEGIKETGRLTHVLEATGHARDHPVHPRLPQSEYLKGLLIRILE